MIKTFISIVFFLSFFSGCFSISSINPFSDNGDTNKESKITKIPENAPKWIKEPHEKNYVCIVGFSYIKGTKVEEFDKKRTLLNASNKLSNKIYLKTINYYKEYEKKLDNPVTFHKDLQNIAKQISLKSISKGTIKDSWLSNDNRLYVRLAVESEFIAQQIQIDSKKIFKVDKTLYKHILSNRAKALLIEFLER